VLQTSWKGEGLGGAPESAKRHTNQALFDSERAATPPLPQVVEEVPTLNKEELEH